MQKKVLFCATVDYHFKAFHLPYLKWFKEQGWEVHIVASGELELPFVDKKYTIPIQRSPFNKMNILAYKELKSIIDQNQYKIIHCHTPMGGVLTRLAARAARKTGTKVIYTAHGFHFCKGAPLLNWLLYYPIEKVLSRFTDCLITINQEDFNLAKKHRFKAEIIKHVHGVGVNTEIFKPVDENHRNMFRKSLGYAPNDFLMFYAAEFNKNKNQKLLIESLALIKDEIPNAKLLLAGEGPLLQECSDLARKLNLENMIDFLGYRNDIDELLKISDIAVASSLREGLPVNIMEAMSSGLPVVANDNRGHRELIENNINGWIIYNNSDILSEKIQVLEKNDELKRNLGAQGRNVIVTKYSIQKILEEKRNIYRLYMDEMEDVLWAVH
ncbi:glycosyltransferase family 4 protein [Neobacillus sp. PS3-40]|uniref:glycosyltransferase family 4 protein n=1 Tax=Neobacillus sp. PS3-40 TaxID=3070679 RepID=UPI0027E09ACE|nr:glycosyltransferase family 4 protein [Neobacillus sp. PS3-40]WML45828.1 glycosyltransferase family 4 protein [Neobacillus sp. PS3-40]